jgi:hypothetical protein
MPGGGELGQHTCSRAGCVRGAVWRLEWRNPKIHTADRVKVWLACQEHVTYLRDFLAARDFPLNVVAIAEAPTHAADNRGQQ